jgi:TldD protein
MNNATLQAPKNCTYSEMRHHEIRKARLLMVDGNLTSNSHTTDGGVSARVYSGGYWGFSSSTASNSNNQISDKARQNALTMGRFGVKPILNFSRSSYCGEYKIQSQAKLTTIECVERMAALQDWCTRKYPKLKSTRLLLADEHHSKWLVTSEGGRTLSEIQRAMCVINFIIENDQGEYIDVYENISGKGSLASLDLSMTNLAPILDRLYEHLMAKRHAVPARGGAQTVVMAAELTGMLAHEAMGHPCEADIVLGGAVTCDLVGERVASELVTMVDFAHTFQDKEVMIPVYADDEGVSARDAILIKDGRLIDFMNSRETAAQLNLEPTGNARAYGPHDEPLVRMRNTAILPGIHKLEAMVAEVEKGYLLLKVSNGQADSTAEFMFGVKLAYEINKGRIGAAVRDTTLSGSAIKVLQSVDAVADDMHWSCAGYCGKKQPMLVSMGGPSLRARAHLGG